MKKLILRAEELQISLISSLDYTLIDFRSALDTKTELILKPELITFFYTSLNKSFKYKNLIYFRS